jgi:hypothetical protein
VHRKSGMIFVYAMLVLSASGAVMATTVRPNGNVMAGVLTFYLVLTAALTVRRSWPCCTGCGAFASDGTIGASLASLNQRQGEMTQIDNAPLRKPIRLWPGVIAAVLVVLVRLVVPLVMPEGAIVGVIGAVVGALAIVV